MKIIRKIWNAEECREEIIEDELNVGDGVTLNYYSDEEAATVIEIDPKGRWIKVQEDKAIQRRGYNFRRILCSERT